MNITRNGKIARLPRAVRQELNRRLQDGEPGKKVVEWLNALPEVQAIVTAEFGGKRIREESLSEWRKGGHRDWLAQQEAMELAERLGEDTAELRAEGRAPLTDTLALWLAARYAVATRRVTEAGGLEGWRLLRELCGDIVELRRGDHSAQRLRLDRERLDFEQERDREKTGQEFEEWARQPENRERLCEGFRIDEEKLARVRQMLFGDPSPQFPGCGGNCTGACRTGPRKVNPDLAGLAELPHEKGGESVVRRSPGRRSSSRASGSAVCRRRGGRSGGNWSRQPSSLG